jgi:heat-inducible transcriptional repressor
MNPRTEQILELVAERHIRSAKPVPSSVIAEQLRISSATVRNEFSALEEAGYLMQPHTSAGRIPSRRGYRRYARKFLPPRTLPEAQRTLLTQSLRGAHGEGLLERVALITADLSGYTVVVTLPTDNELQMLEIHLSALSSRRTLAVVVLENGLVRQLALELSPTPSDSNLLEAESSLRRLTLPVREVPQALSDIAARAHEDVARTYRALAEAWPQMRAPRVFSGGLKHLFSEPEAADPSFVKRVLERVETPETTAEALALVFEESLALVSAQLELGGSRAGLLLLGPLRMRYPETLMIARGVTETVAENLN